MPEEEEVNRTSLPPSPHAAPGMIQPPMLDLTALKARALAQIDAVLPTTNRKVTYTYAELHAKKDEVQRFLVPDLIPAEAVTLLIGEDGIGKTQICTQLCLSVAFGYADFLGMPLKPKHRRCLIMATEDSRQKWINACVKQSYRMEPRHKPEDVHISFTEGSDFDDFIAMKEELEMQLSKAEHDLVIADAFGDMFTLIDGEINSNSHARKLLSFLQHVCNTYGCALILIHHAAKSKIVVKQREGKIFVEKGDSQGAGAITQKPRTVLALSNDPRSTSGDGSWYTNYLHVVKANLMGKQFMQNAIKLKFDASSLLHDAQGLVDIQMMMEAAPPAANGNGEAPGGGFNRRKPKPQELSDETHLQTLALIYRNGNWLPKKELVFRMGAQYGVGDTKVVSSLENGGFLAYVAQKGWVQGNADTGFLFAAATTAALQQPAEHYPTSSTPDESDDVPF